MIAHRFIEKICCSIEYWSVRLQLLWFSAEEMSHTKRNLNKVKQSKTQKKASAFCWQQTNFVYSPLTHSIDGACRMVNITVHKYIYISKWRRAKIVRENSMQREIVIDFTSVYSTKFAPYTVEPESLAIDCVLTSCKRWTKPSEMHMVN